jgi:hypothetical protein
MRISMPRARGTMIMAPVNVAIRSACEADAWQAVRLATCGMAAVGVGVDGGADPLDPL